MSYPALNKILFSLTAVMFAILLVSAGIITPALEAPDEEAHYYFIRYLWLNRTLPILEMNDRGLDDPQYEAFQPPAYYVFALLTAWPVGNELSEPLRSEWNPFVTTDLNTLSNENKIGILTDTTHNFPYASTARAIHVIRFASIILGLVYLLIIFKLARTLFEQDEERLAYSAIALFIPGVVFSFAVINNDNAAILLGALMLLFAWRLACEPDSRPAWISLALICGFATLSKMTLVGFVPAIGVLGMIVWRRSTDRRALVLNILLFIGIWLAMAGWWFWRNLSLYGELTGVQRMQRLTGEPGNYPLSHVWANSPWIWQSFWGRLAGQHFPLPWAVYDFFALLTTLSLIGWGWRLAKGFKSFHPGWVIFVAALAGMIGVVLFYAANLAGGALGRYLYPALGGFAALWLIGLLSLVPARARRWACYALWAAMLVLASLSIWYWLPSAYSLPPRLAAFNLPPGFAPLNYQYGDSVQLHGLTLSSLRVQPGDSLTVTLYWETQQPIDTSYAVFLQLIDDQNNKLAQRETFSGKGMYPTKRWLPGEIVVDEIALSIDPNASAPQAYRLIGGLWNIKTGERLPLRGGELYRLAEVVVAPPTSGQLPPTSIPLTAEFDLGIALRGCSPPTSESNELTLFWLATASVPRDYTVLAHLWDGENTFVAGVDHPPMQGRFPTRFWQTNDWIADTFVLPEQDRVARIDVGLYASDTLERLPVLNPPHPDRLFSLPTKCWKS